MPDDAPSGPRGRRVLVADDEEGIRRLVTRIIQTKGLSLGVVEILQAESAEHALAILEHERVDLVLTDYRMGGKTGEQLLAEVSSRWPSTGRILMTGYHDLAENANTNAEVVVRKPWNNAALVETISHVLSTARPAQ